MEVIRFLLKTLRLPEWLHHLIRRYWHGLGRAQGILSTCLGTFAKLCTGVLEKFSAIEQQTLVVVKHQLQKSPKLESVLQKSSTIYAEGKTRVSESYQFQRGQELLSGLSLDQKLIIGGYLTILYHRYRSYGFLETIRTAFLLPIGLVATATLNALLASKVSFLTKSRVLSMITRILTAHAIFMVLRI